MPLLLLLVLLLSSPVLVVVLESVSRAGEDWSVGVVIDDRAESIELELVDVEDEEVMARQGNKRGAERSPRWWRCGVVWWWWEEEGMWTNANSRRRDR